jgi:formate/nitrite transporter
MGGDQQVFSTVKGPKEAYISLAAKGELTVQDYSITVFLQSFYAGCYIGFGALLATIISCSMPGFTQDNPGFKSFVFAALFPVNLLLILLTGGILFTGTSAACPAAFYEGKAKILDCARCLALSWLGNVLGSALFAVFTQYCGLLEGSTKAGAIGIMKKKCSKDFGVTFAKGIGCNWMVCMAVFLCGQAQDLSGKYLGIWFPISTFVMIGFEHIPANFYLLEIGLLAGDSDVTFWDVMWKNWIPVTLGNFFAGAFIVAGGYSFFFGRWNPNYKESQENTQKAYAMKSAAMRSMGFSEEEGGEDGEQKEEEEQPEGPVSQPEQMAVIKAAVEASAPPRPPKVEEDDVGSEHADDHDAEAHRQNAHDEQARETLWGN